MAIGGVPNVLLGVMCQMNHHPGYFRLPVMLQKQEQPWTEQAILTKNGWQQPVSPTKNCLAGYFLMWMIFHPNLLSNGIQAKSGKFKYFSFGNEGLRTSFHGRDTQHMILKYAPRTLLHTKPCGEDKVWGCVWNTGVLSRPGAASGGEGRVVSYVFSWGWNTEHSQHI